VVAGLPYALFGRAASTRLATVVEVVTGLEVLISFTLVLIVLIAASGLTWR
jgi:hypothetical protein